MQCDIDPVAAGVLPDKSGINPLGILALLKGTMEGGLSIPASGPKVLCLEPRAMLAPMVRQPALMTAVERHPNRSPVQPLVVPKSPKR